MLCFLFNIVFAFVGENETRKDFFKAQLLLQCLIIGLLFAIHGYGLFAVVLKLLSETADSWPEFWKGLQLLSRVAGAVVGFELGFNHVGGGGFGLGGDVWFDGIDPETTVLAVGFE